MYITHVTTKATARQLETAARRFFLTRARAATQFRGNIGKTMYQRRRHLSQNAQNELRAFCVGGKGDMLKKTDKVQ